MNHPMLNSLKQRQEKIFFILFPHIHIIFTVYLLISSFTHVKIERIAEHFILKKVNDQIIMSEFVYENRERECMIICLGNIY